MNRKPRVFLSRTTKGLASLADKVAVLLDDMGFEVIHQPDFTMSWRKIRHMLMEKLRECDAVLCLVGPAYGFAPKTTIPEFRDPDTGRETFSYTQIEYLIARRLHRPVFTILVQDDCATFPLDPFTQDDTERNLQRDFIRDTIRKDEHLRYGYTTHSDLLEAIRKTVLPRDLSALPPSYPENIPFPSIGKIFTGRNKTLRELRETLVASGSTNPAVQVVHGTGGVGKTRVTVEYSHRYKSDYNARLFVTGSSPEALDSALANLAGIFLLNLEEQDEKENDVRIAAVLRWLALHPGWLLVIDNVDTQEARDHVLRIVSKLPPGHVLITTRLHTWPGDLRRTPLDVLSDTDGRDVLLGYRSSPKAEAEETDAADALALAHDLDGLALALEQAAAYLNRIAITIAEYHQRWKINADRVKAWHDPETMSYPASVATTLLNSFEQLAPASQSLLNLLAWLAPDPIPRSLLKSLADKKLQPDPLSGTDPAKALGELTDFSLAKPDRKGVAFTVHRLIQEIVRGRQQPVIPPHLVAAVSWMYGEFPSDFEDAKARAIALPLAPHAFAVTYSALNDFIPEPSMALAVRCAQMLLTRGDYRKAELLYRRMLTVVEESTAPRWREPALDGAAEAESRIESPVVATQLNRLAKLLQSTRQFEEAEQHLRRALVIDEANFGSTHHFVARDLYNLAQLLQDADRIEEAEPLMRRALALTEKEFEANHPQVAICHSSLGVLLRAAGRFDEAEPHLRRALAIDEAHFGKDHPAVARDLNNLTALMYAANRLGEIEPLMRRAIDLAESFYGNDDPNVALQHHNFGIFLCNTNRPDEAEMHLRKSLAINEAFLDAKHSAIGHSLGWLANLLKDSGRLNEAEPLMRRSLAISETSDGEDSLEVATRLNNLARLLQEMERPAEAEPLVRRTVQIFAKLSHRIGRPHPHLMDVMTNYGGLLMHLGATQAQADEKIRATIESVGKGL